MMLWDCWWKILLVHDIISIEQILKSIDEITTNSYCVPHKFCNLFIEAY